MGEGTGMDGRAAGKTQGHPGQAWLLSAWMKGWRDGECWVLGGGCGSWEGGCVTFWYPNSLEKQSWEMETSSPPPS